MVPITKFMSQFDNKWYIIYYIYISAKNCVQYLKDASEKRISDNLTEECLSQIQFFA